MNLRRALLLVLLAGGLLMALGVVVFRATLGLSWIEAIYFVTATVTTVGYGDINLRDAPPGVQLFGSFLMAAGAASFAAGLGIVTDLVLRARLREFLAKRRQPMQDHIVLCGLGNVGFRVLEHLQKLGQPVTVVEQHSDNRFLDEARAMQVPVVVGDIRLDSPLEEAQVGTARCLIAATNDDLANLDVALSARELNPQIHVVLRMFDQKLAAKVRGAFDIATAFSTSALAAPAFAMAAVDPSVVGSCYVGNDLLLNVELAVAAGTELAGMNSDELARRGTVQLLAHTSAATGRRQLHPDEPQTLAPGDHLVISTVPEFLPQLRALNSKGD